MERILRLASRVWLFPMLLTLGHAPAFGQVNFAGVWNNFPLLHEDEPERLPAPNWAITSESPIRDAARYRADAWDASLITLPEYRSAAFTPPTTFLASGRHPHVREEFDKDSQQLIAIHTHHFAWGTERTIWMDGRPHPPGVCDAHIAGLLDRQMGGRRSQAVTTTHLKEGWIRRNGLIRSDRATVTEHFIRHGDNLTIMTVIRDPAYLTRADDPHTRLYL